MSIPASAARRPTVLRSLRSTVLLDGRGDLELLREARGAEIEWGGVYGQLVRLTGAWRLALVSARSRGTLPETLVRASTGGELFESQHRFEGMEVVQRVVPLDDRPGACRALLLRNPGPETVRLEVESTLEPYLLPVLVEGIRPVAYEADLGLESVEFRHRGFAFALRSSRSAQRLSLEGRERLPGRHTGPVGSVGHGHDLEIPAGGSVELRWELVGGLEREVRSLLGRTALAPADPQEAQRRLLEAERAWEDRTPRLRFPGSEKLTAAYGLARSALRRLYTQPTDELPGLVAGYPWYAAVWCRDVAWMLPALLWLGDLEWAERTIDTVLRYQARADLPIVGAETGELPMQIAPGPIFFYGTSDTTLYFPTLAARLLRHGGGLSLFPRWSESLGRALMWGARRTDATSGLLRNGGEAAELETATGSVARIRYGIDAQDTTIWDSADRRDHAIDVQVLWYEALRAAEELGLRLPIDPGGLAERLSRTLSEAYPWKEERYLYDSWRAGAPVPRLRPNALRAVSAGLLSAERAHEVVLRAAEPDLSAPWGVRTLSSRDAGYQPLAYHGGQVWPIATAWAADAALSVGEVDLGVRYLETIADGLIREEGQANECYRGDRPEPFDSCFLLGLSVGPFLAVLFERLWGVKIDARAPALYVRPRFPPAWPGATVENLRIGGGRAALEVVGSQLNVSWQGPVPLRVTTAAAASAVPSGGRVSLDLGSDPS